MAGDGSHVTNSYRSYFDAGPEGVDVSSVQMILISLRAASPWALLILWMCSQQYMRSFHQALYTLMYILCYNAPYSRAIVADVNTINASYRAQTYELISTPFAIERYVKTLILLHISIGGQPGCNFDLLCSEVETYRPIQAPPARIDGDHYYSDALPRSIHHATLDARKEKKADTFAVLWKNLPAANIPVPHDRNQTQFGNTAQQLQC